MADRSDLLEELESRDISSHLLSKLKHAQLTARAALEAEFDRLGLTVTQFLALAFISENPDISSAELARRSYVSAQAMMTIVARMQAANLITRAPASSGGRSLSLALTPEGERLLEQAGIHAGSIERYLVDALGEGAYRQLADSLDRVTQALGQGATMTRTTPWQTYLPPEERTP